MKQMSRLEVQSFVDFGPRYFDYINKAIKEDVSTQSLFDKFNKAGKPKDSQPQKILSKRILTRSEKIKRQVQLLLLHRPVKLLKDLRTVNKWKYSYFYKTKGNLWKIIWYLHKILSRDGVRCACRCQLPRSSTGVQKYLMPRKSGSETQR